MEDSTTIIGVAAGALVVLVVLFLVARSRGKAAGQAKTETAHPSAPFPIPDAPPPSSRAPSRPPPKKKDEPPPSFAPEPVQAKREPEPQPPAVAPRAEP